MAQPFNLGTSIRWSCSPRRLRSGCPQGVWRTSADMVVSLDVSAILKPYADDAGSRLGSPHDARPAALGVPPRGLRLATEFAGR